MKDVLCYELFGGIAPKNHAFSFHFLHLHSPYRLLTYLMFLLHYIFFIYFIASKIFSSHCLQVKFLENIAVTLFIPPHLLCICMPHYRYKTETTFTFMLLTPHGETLLLDEPSIVLPPMTITSVCPRITYRSMFAKI